MLPFVDPLTYNLVANFACLAFANVATLYLKNGWTPSFRLSVVSNDLYVTRYLAEMFVVSKNMM